MAKTAISARKRVPDVRRTLYLGFLGKLRESWDFMSSDFADSKNSANLEVYKSRSFINGKEFQTENRAMRTIADKCREASDLKRHANNCTAWSSLLGNRFLSLSLVPSVVALSGCSVVVDECSGQAHLGIKGEVSVPFLRLLLFLPSDLT